MSDKKEKEEADKTRFDTREGSAWLFSGALFYILWILLTSMDFEAVRTKHDMEGEEKWFPDYFYFPMAKHRLHNLRGREYFEEMMYHYHRTETSVDDFLYFMENESSQARPYI